MENAAETVKNLERKFWQSLVDQDAESALQLLQEPALMISSHGTTRFDRAAYRSMLQSGKMELRSFELGDIDVLMPNDSTAILTYDVKQTVAQRGDAAGGEQQMHDSSTWVRSGGSWKCVAHTETPVQDSTRQSAQRSTQHYTQKPAQQNTQKPAQKSAQDSSSGTRSQRPNETEAGSRSLDERQESGRQQAPDSKQSISRHTPPDRPSARKTS